MSEVGSCRPDHGYGRWEANRRRQLREPCQGETIEQIENTSTEQDKSLAKAALTDIHLGNQIGQVGTKGEYDD